MIQMTIINYMPSVRWKLVLVYDKLLESNSKSCYQLLSLFYKHTLLRVLASHTNTFDSAHLLLFLHGEWHYEKVEEFINIMRKTTGQLRQHKPPFQLHYCHAPPEDSPHASTKIQVHSSDVGPLASSMVFIVSFLWTFILEPYIVVPI